MIGRLAVAAWLAAGSAALAQQPITVPKPPPPTAEQIAAAKADGEALIARYKVDDLFETLAGAGQPTIRHKASGLLCAYTSRDSALTIQVYPGKPRGDDVSCGMKVGDFTLTLYATRVGDAADAETLMRQAVSAIKTQHSDLAPFSGHQVAKAVAPNLPDMKTARFQYAENGEPVFTRVSIALARGWMVEERETGPLDHAISGADTIGEFVFVSSLISVVRPDLVLASPPSPAPGPASGPQ